MPNHNSLDELITKKADEFADQIKGVAAMADKEEEIRIEVEKQLAFIQKEAGIKLEGKHEFTVASGRVDSVYSRVIIEYKNPKSADRIGPKADSPGSKKVIQQIKNRFYDMRTQHGQPLNSLFGVGLDGKYFIFIRFRDEKWQVQEPVEVNRYSAERFLWALFNLGKKGKPFSPEYLAVDYGSEGVNSVAINGIHALYDAIITTNNPKAQTFFSQWKILFGEVCGYEVDNPSDNIKELAEFYKVNTKNPKPAEILFAVHTYYALFMKLLTAEIVAFFHMLPTPLQKMMQAGTTIKLKREMEDLEAGSIFRHFNITNFLEGDLFAWYVSIWDAPIEKLVRDMVARLDNYNPGTLSEDPAGSRDLLKRLYHKLFPKSVRHDLGEYYTPDWLAQHVLNELGYAGDPEKRFLDPACGSGTFIIMTINRIRRWYDENREKCRFDEGELCRKILSNVIGFDLNPLAVMAARTNYLIAIRDLIGHVEKVEIPIYLCDSIVTPAEYGDLFTGTGKVAQIPCSACKPPHLLVPKEVAHNRKDIATYTSLIEHSLKVRSSPAEFATMCVEEGLTISDARMHKTLYAELLALDKANKNGMWARIIKNAFAPLFCGRVDYVAGNPPWVNWEHLPAEYRATSKEIWKQYGLVGDVSIKKRQQSNAFKTDLSILMTYVAADAYLKKDGKLGFVMTRTVFQSELGGWHFRGFKLPQLRHLKVESVHDVDALKPFRGQAANITCVAFFKLDSPTVYPVPWLSFVAKDGATISEDTSYEEALSIMKKRSWIATPINPKQKQSSWIFGDRKGISALLELLGPSDYAKVVREGINTRGANGVFFLDAGMVMNHLMIKNRPQDGDDRKLPIVEQSIEPDYIYPLLRGQNVARWTAEAESYVLLPHTKEHPTSTVSFSLLPPKTKEFLATHQEKLKGRKKFRNFDPSGSEWYGLYSVLSATFMPHKVVFREMAEGAIASTVSNQQLPSGERKIVIPDHKLFIIPCESEDEANFICGFFNSEIGNYLIRSYALATGISTHVLDRLPIPRFNSRNSLHIKISETAHKCSLLAKRGSSSIKAEELLNEAIAELLNIKPQSLKAIQLALAELVEL